jgi:hypothetical protein
VLAKQVLSQLSYTPTVGVPFILKHLPRFQNPFLRIFIEWSEPEKCDSLIVHSLQELAQIQRFNLDGLEQLQNPIV